MKTYKSKIGLSMAIPILITLGTVSLFFMIKGQWIPLIFILAVDVFCVHMFATTYYVIEAGDLSLHCGFLYHKTLPVTSIFKIEENGNVSNGPATSFDRLEIFYNTHDSVLVSPANKEEFVDDLLALNPAIKLQTGT